MEFKLLCKEQKFYFYDGFLFDLKKSNFDLIGVGLVCFFFGSFLLYSLGMWLMPSQEKEAAPEMAQF